MRGFKLIGVTLGVIGISLMTYIAQAAGALTVITPLSPLQTTIGLPVNFAYTPDWYIAYDPTETFGLGLQPYVTLGGTFLNLQCNGAGVLEVNQNPGWNTLSLQANTGTATMNFGLTAGLNLEFIAFGDILNGSLNTHLLPNNGDLGFYDSQSFSSYLLNTPVAVSSTLSTPLLPPINTLDAFTLWFGIAIPSWLAGINLDINADTTISQSIKGQNISTSAGSISSDGQTLNAYVNGTTYQLQNVQETWQDTTSLTLGLGADLTASLLWDTLSVTLVNFGDVPLITTARTYPLTSTQIPSLQFNINATTATSILLSCNVSPNQNVTPGSLITVSGTAVYNNGQAVQAATVTISVGGQIYTAPISNGNYSRQIAAPSSAGTYQVSVTASDGNGRAGSNSASLAVSSNGTTSGYTIGNFLTCSNVDSASPYNYSGQIDGFGSAAPRFYTWIELDNITGAHSVEVRLYRPDGSYYGNATGTAGVSGNSYSWWRIWWYWNVSGYDIAYTPGVWDIKLYVDGNYEQSISFTIRYELTEHQMAKDVQTTSPYDPIQPSNIFSQTDQKAVVWLNLDKVSDPINVKWVFYEPNGSDYFETIGSSPSPDASGYGYWISEQLWGWIDIAGNSAANKCGNWKVDVLIQDPSGNWVKQYTDYFTILENPPIPPSASVSATPASPQAGQSITFNVACADNTYLQTVVLYWNDGSLRSNVWNNIIAGSFSQSASIGSYSAGQQIQYWIVATDTSGNTTESSQNTLSISPLSGSLQVNISPQGAIDDGALWQVDSGAWQNSGTAISGLVVGLHTVSFEPVQGWSAPNDQSVLISAGWTTTIIGAYTPVAQPSLSASPTNLSQTIVAGQNASNQTLQVWNAGSGTLNYTVNISTNAPWLSASPTSGASTGEVDTIQVNYNTATLTAGTYSATIAVIAPSATNSPQTVDVNLVVNRTNSNSQALFVSDASGNIYEFTPGGSRTTFASGLSLPEGLVFNSAGNLFVADAKSVSIYEFTPDGVQSTFASGLGDPMGLAFNSAGELFEADSSSGNIYDFASGGTPSTFFSDPMHPGFDPRGLAFSSAGNLFVAGVAGNIFEFTPSGARSNFAYGLSWPQGLAFNNAGDLFVTDINSGNIYEFTPDGVQSTFASGLDEPWGLAFNNAGDLFVADFGSGNIYKFTSGGVRSTFATGLVGPTFLAFQPIMVNVVLSGRQVVLSWPQNETNYYLESTTNLILQTVWTMVTNNSAVTNGRNTVTLPVTGSSKYFRLHSQ